MCSVLLWSWPYFKWLPTCYPPCTASRYEAGSKKYIVTAGKRAIADTQHYVSHSAGVLFGASLRTCHSALHVRCTCCICGAALCRAVPTSRGSAAWHPLHQLQMCMLCAAGRRIDC